MMRKFLRPILALALAAAGGLGAEAGALDMGSFVTGFGNASYGSQMSYDAYNMSVRKRFESVRIGAMSSPLGGYRTSSYNNYAPGAGYSQTPGYTNPNPGYNSGYGAAPGYNPSYNPGYNPGYAPPPATQGFNANPSGYNPGYNPQGYTPGYTQPQGYGAPAAGGYNTYNTGFGANGYSSLGSFSSDGAYAMAPSSRASSVSSARRRQLDCVYYSGFTAWADIYQTWARQRSTNSYEEGYDFRTTGPAIGFDWTSGPVTVGAATTYNWGKLSGRDITHEQKISTWALTLYGQYNSDNFYINGTLGYGHSRFDSERSVLGGGQKYGNDYTSNSVNVDAEFGWKMAWGGFNVIPTAGIRFFHDRMGSIHEGYGLYANQVSGDNYHVLELPLGVNFSYEINTGGMVFVPRGRVAWIPELERTGGSWSGTYYDAAGVLRGRGEDAANRSRHGFQLSLGLEAKITKALSAHVDYTANLRSRQYEHHWNLGMGFSF